MKSNQILLSYRGNKDYLYIIGKLLHVLAGNMTKVGSAGISLGGVREGYAWINS